MTVEFDQLFSSSITDGVRGIHGHLSQTERTELFVCYLFSQALARETGRQISILNHHKFQNSHDCDGFEKRRKLSIELTQVVGSKGEEVRGNAALSSTICEVVEKKLSRMYDSLSKSDFILLVYQFRFIRSIGEYLKSGYIRVEDVVIPARHTLGNASYQPFNEVWFLRINVGRKVTPEKPVQLWPYSEVNS